jgi:hypothetical protein
MDLADGLQLTSKQEKQLESAVAILSGVGAWEYQSTQAFDNGVSLISKQRFGDAIAQTFGSNVAQKLFPNTQIQGKQTLNPSGIVNSTSLTGVGLLIVDKLAEEFLGHSYTGMDGLQPLIRGTGKGLTVGGGFGGLFDPATSYGRGIPAMGSTVGPRGQSFDAGQRVSMLNR